MAQTCVLDASAVIRLICADPTAAPWTPILAEAPLVMAPELMLTEVTNTLVRELVDEVVADRHLHAEALALALARREAASLITADRRLRQLSERVLP